MSKTLTPLERLVVAKETRKHLRSVFAEGACDHCGGDVQIWTDAERVEGFDWYAHTDDDAMCLSCLSEGVVDVEEEGESASISMWDRAETPATERAPMNDALSQIAQAAGLGAPDRVSHYYLHARPHAEACWGDADIEIAVSRWAAGVVIERLDARIWSLQSYVSEYDCRMAGRVLAAVLAAEAPRDEEGGS